MKIKQIITLGLIGVFLLCGTAIAAPTLAEPAKTTKPIEVAAAFNQKTRLHQS
jgi:hypothetical protein